MENKKEASASRKSEIKKKNKEKKYIVNVNNVRQPITERKDSLVGLNFGAASGPFGMRSNCTTKQGRRTEHQTTTKEKRGAQSAHTHARTYSLSRFARSQTRKEKRREHTHTHDSSKICTQG